MVVVMWAQCSCYVSTHGSYYVSHTWYLHCSHHESTRLFSCDTHMVVTCRTQGKSCEHTIVIMCCTHGRSCEHMVVVMWHTLLVMWAKPKVPSAWKGPYGPASSWSLWMPSPARERQECTWSGGGGWPHQPSLHHPHKGITETPE